MNIDALQLFFETHNHQWRIGGKMMIPTTEDLQKAIDNAIERLYNEEVGTTLAVGRLIIERSQDKTFDIYVHFGEIDEHV